MKKLLSTILVLCLVLGSISVYSIYGANNDKIKIELDGKLISLSESPVIHNNRTLIPLRGLFEKMGATVDWNKQSKQAIIKTKDVEVLVTVDELYSLVNGRISGFDTATQLIDDHVYVPVRFISEALGHEVKWDAKTKTVVVNSKAYQKSNELPKIKDEDEFIELININKGLNDYIYGGKYDGIMRYDVEGDLPTLKAKESSALNNVAMADEAAEESSAHSDTNSQVEGVGEGDMTVTNGKYIATSKWDELSLIKVDKGMAKLVYQEKMKGTISELYLTEDKLVVINTEYVGNEDARMADSYYGGEDITRVRIYDMTADKPVLKTDKSFSGYCRTSRLIDENLYLITNKNFYFYRDIPVTIEGITPYMTDELTGLKNVKEINDVYYLPGYVTPNFTNLAYVNIDTGDSKFDSYLGSCDTVYASKNAIYLAEQSYHYEITKEAEQFLPKYKTETNIYKFALDGKNIVYKAEGKVDGEVVNQFSLDEYNNNFRIATTTGSDWYEEDEQKNHLFILDENLNEVGSVKDLAKGEKIYSVRFNGDRAYMVTFKTVDPLFVIDCKNPAKPEVLGYLKIPGFSTYMHMLDQNHILGFGSDTKEENDNVKRAGFKISLFDVTDPQNPKEVKSEIIGKEGTYSELEHNHKALMISLKKGIFAFPISIATDTPYVTKFQGSYVYNVSENDFSYKGNVEQSNKEDYQYQIKRTLYIGNYLYSLSDNDMIITDLKTMKKVGSIEIPEMEKEE